MSSNILQALNSTNKSKAQIYASNNKLHVRASEIESKLDILNATCGNINVSVGDVDVNTDGLEALATAGNATLALINGKVTVCDTGAVVVSSSALPSGASTAINQNLTNTILSTIDGKISVCDTGAVVVSSSALPSGGATSALQTSGNTELNNILLELQTPSSLATETTLQDVGSEVANVTTSVDDANTKLVDILSDIQSNGSKLDDIVTNTGFVSTPARNVVNVASASSISAGSDVGSGVDMTDYKSAVISGSTSQYDSLEIWVSNDGGTTYRFMASICTNSDDSGNPYYHKVINNVAGYIKLKLPSSASSATISLDVVRQDW